MNDALSCAIDFGSSRVKVTVQSPSGSASEGFGWSERGLHRSLNRDWVSAIKCATDIACRLADELDGRIRRLTFATVGPNYAFTAEDDLEKSSGPLLQYDSWPDAMGSKISSGKDLTAQQLRCFEVLGDLRRRSCVSGIERPRL